MAKKRTEIPPDIAARLLFQHDRTCCVCRRRGKPVQVHHIDDDPANHDPGNLAVLCFECHRDTEIRGGFDRKLDQEQIVLYRDDWIKLVTRYRAEEEGFRQREMPTSDYELKSATSIAEIYRENAEYELLAIHYHNLGNHELRDKYVELALQKSSTDGEVSFLRALQGRPDLIPKHVIERELRQHDAARDWQQKGRFLFDLGRYAEACLAYVRGIHESLDKGNTFGAAYYLKELAQKELPERLFQIALREASERGDLWWQVRALQKLLTRA